MVSRIKFIGLMPNIIECCAFIPDRFKSHETLFNKAMHKLCTPFMLSAFFLSSSLPDLSTSFVVGSFMMHVVGHLFEGLFN